MEPAYHLITTVKKQLKEIETLLDNTNNYFNNYDYSDDIFNDYKTDIYNSFVSKDINEFNELINKKMIKYIICS